MFNQCIILSYPVGAVFTLRVQDNPQLRHKLAKSFVNEAVKETSCRESNFGPRWRHDHIVNRVSEWHFGPVLCRHGTVVVQRRYQHNRHEQIGRTQPHPWRVTGVYHWVGLLGAAIFSTHCRRPASSISGSLAGLCAVQVGTDDRAETWVSKKRVEF